MRLGVTPQPLSSLQDADAKALLEMEPHIYALAEAAFRGMLIELKPQALLISGESGAGKTEAVKACLRYVVSRSGHAAAEQGAGDMGARTQRARYVEDCIMQANPLLEALGNAKTVRNGNSSRFGKWIEVQFDAAGSITASKITSYLLEKSRVTEHGPGERSYHSLYQLVRGATAEQRQELRLLALADFRYIGESAGVVVPTVDDVAWWKATCHAMQVFGMSAEDTAGVRQVLAAVLHIGNLAFDVLEIASQDDGAQVAPAAQPSLQAAAALLGLTSEALEQALTVKLVGKFPVVQVPQSPAKATSTRDAFAKALYGQLFEWTIGRINATMGGGSSAGSLPADAKRTIGMLDIFGFEAFQRNSLEQLLINFANEKLQSHFNEYIFKLEEAECAREGVACPKLEFADNSAVMALMTAKPAGVLSLTNEEVVVPNGSDDSLLQKLQQQHRAHDRFKLMPRAQGEGFVIHHYAGPVAYHIAGFVEKNRDQLPGELTQVLSSAQMPLLKALFTPAAADEPPKSARGGGARGRTGGGGRRNTALASQFAESLESLMGVLATTTPHFVRCVKPNFQQAANELDGAYVMRQLKEMGMVHVVRARKQGFAHRYPFARFLERYGYLLKGRGRKTRPTRRCGAPAWRARSR
jgi:myosin heavy subunit